MPSRVAPPAPSFVGCGFGGTNGVCLEPPKAFHQRIQQTPKLLPELLLAACDLVAPQCESKWTARPPVL